jgi:hypothetical protein
MSPELEELVQVLYEKRRWLRSLRQRGLPGEAESCKFALI